MSELDQHTTATVRLIRVVDHRERFVTGKSCSNASKISELKVCGNWNLPVHWKALVGEIQVHQKPSSSKSKFVKISKNSITRNIFIKIQFHQKPFATQMKLRVGTEPNTAKTILRFCESVGKPAMLSEKQDLCPPFDLQQTFMWSIAFMAF